MSSQYDPKEDAKLLAATVFGVLALCEGGSTPEEIYQWIKADEMNEVAARVINDGDDDGEIIDLRPNFTVIQGGKP